MSMNASTDAEELRLQIRHLRAEMEAVATIARNSVKTNSADPESWRADMQMVAERLEARLAT
ncbi:hypothetical protein [Duganella vulcania]|uniref:Uncharacterized protein n=1 Tax=Duganella vulcania TaxID=2692166 RepID=A0A845GI72_9BURK|nr:hypothetical protein [Duganella vulcania]MYM92467.1 hypothetical protein [Duganella vulcania]